MRWNGVKEELRGCHAKKPEGEVVKRKRGTV